MKRFQSIDSLRGLVMVIMALDHVRDFFHTTALTANPTDLNTTTPALFWTRVITHLCAPTFLFLSGVSVYLNKTVNKRQYLLTRGALLILFDFTLIAFGLFWSFQSLLFNVLAAIGTGFILLAFLYRVPKKVLLIIGILLVVGNAFLPIPGLTAPTAFPLSKSILFIVGYPPLPWFGIMLIGYAIAPQFLEKKTWIWGIIGLFLFFLLRFWEVKDFDLLNLFNVNKYPPALSFTLLTLSVMALLFSYFQRRPSHFLNVFGRVPLFYFIVHWYVMHILLFAYLLIEGFTPSQFEFGQNLGRPGSWSGVELPGVYLAWILTVLIMYPLCQLYYKKGRIKYI